MTIKHLMFTRFNIPSGGSEVRIRSAPGWLDHRFELFERFCIPGVEYQNNKSFEWIVFFDAETPDAYKRRIENLSAGGAFQPIYTSSGDMGEISRAAARAKVSGDWLLTSRLDSDDVLASDYVQRLQGLCTQPSRRVLNLDRGLIYAPGPAPALYETADACNPFAALLEPGSASPDTIWSANHRDIERLGPLRNVAGAPAWMQVVHGRNVSNDVRGRRVPLQKYAGIFPLEEIRSAADESPGSIAFENLVSRPARVARRMMGKAAARMRGSRSA